MAKAAVIMRKGITKASRTKRLVYKKLPTFPDGGAILIAEIENLRSDFVAIVDVCLDDFLFLDFFLDIECPPFCV